MNKTLEMEKDALFIAWSEDRKTAAPRPLQDWIARYPDYADDLVRWMTTHPTLEVAAQMPADAEGEARVRTLGRQVIAEMRARYDTRLVGLLATAKARGLNADTLAERLEIGQPLVIKLERRLLRFASLPGQLIDRLAETLQVSAEQVRAYLRQPPTLAAGASYKSDRIPQTTAQQDFAQAVRACDEMTAAQKTTWLAAETIGAEGD
jgi:hypothetical protein